MDEAVEVDKAMAEEKKNIPPHSDTEDSDTEGLVSSFNSNSNDADDPDDDFVDNVTPVPPAEDEIIPDGEEPPVLEPNPTTEPVKPTGLEIFLRDNVSSPELLRNITMIVIDLMNAVASQFQATGVIPVQQFIQLLNYYHAFQEARRVVHERYTIDLDRVREFIKVRSENPPSSYICNNEDYMRWLVHLQAKHDEQVRLLQEFRFNVEGHYLLSNPTTDRFLFRVGHYYLYRQPENWVGPHPFDVDFDLYSIPEHFPGPIYRLNDAPVQYGNMTYYPPPTDQPPAPTRIPSNYIPPPPPVPPTPEQMRAAIGEALVANQKNLILDAAFRIAAADNASRENRNNARDNTEATNGALFEDVNNADLPLPYQTPGGPLRPTGQSPRRRQRPYDRSPGRKSPLSRASPNRSPKIASGANRIPIPSRNYRIMDYGTSPGPLLAEQASISSAVPLRDSVVAGTATPPGFYNPEMGISHMRSGDEPEAVQAWGPISRAPQLTSSPANGFNSQTFGEPLYVDKLNVQASIINNMILHPPSRVQPVTTASPLIATTTPSMAPPVTTQPPSRQLPSLLELNVSFPREILVRQNRRRDRGEGNGNASSASNV